MFCALRRSLLRSPLVQLNQKVYSSKFEPIYINYNRYISRKPLNLNENFLKLIRGFSSKDYPEHVIIKLPALSPTMESGGVASWNKKEGDEVSEGDVIAEVETDKATVAVEADDAGFVAKILIPAGTSDVKVGTPICIIVEKKEHVPAFKDFDATKLKVDAPSEKQPPPAQVPVTTEQPSSMKKTPPSRKPAIDFNKRRESGPGTKQQEPQPSTPVSIGQTPTAAEGKYTDHPVSNIRAVIAKRLVQSKKEIPHFYLSIDVDLTKMEAMRLILNSELAKSGVKISVNDIIVKASALACKDVPEANSSWMDKKIRHFSSVDVSVAVSTPTGLITPIVFDADKKMVREISVEIKELAKKARQGTLKPHEYQGGTFTVSNLGMFGINQFYAIINPPQSCILAVGTAGEKLYMKDSKISTIGVQKFIKVCLSCDHRVVDGSVGAQWLQAFKNFMEEPKTMF